MVFCVLCAMKIAICFSFTTCLALDFTARRLSLCLNRFPYYFIRLLVASPHTAALARILLDFSKFLWMIVDTFWTHFPMGSQKKRRRKKCRQLCGMEISIFHEFSLSSTPKSQLWEFFRKISHVNDNAHVSPHLSCSLRVLVLFEGFCFMSLELLLLEI